MYYITGDTHANFRRIKDFVLRHQTTYDDVMIILGDAGFNFHADFRDESRKYFMEGLTITLFCIHGNHERRPGTIPTYQEKVWNGGKVYYEPEYPHILFAQDGEVYDFDGMKAIVIGGAYSVDKAYRTPGISWWPDEQPSDEIKQYVEKQLEKHNWNIDLVLTHTAPLKYEPVEVFLSGIDQSSVDKSTEQWLDQIEDRLTYKHWYLGHYHTVKKIDRISIMYENIDELSLGKGVMYDS